MEFKEKLKMYQKMINSELDKYYNKTEIAEEKKIIESAKYSLMAGGKRVRPILVMATYELFCSDISFVLDYAAAIEMVHNFSLIHDDLPGIDNDDLRHGKPSNHKAFGEATAILAGDMLLNKAYMTISLNLLSDMEERKIKIFNEFTLAVDKMIKGEHVDTEFEGKQISKDVLEYIHKNKTGELIKLPVRMGAILGGATEEQLNDLTKYAEKIGLAFQVKDDILSEEGDISVIGKPVGNDKELDKRTYVSEYGLEGAKDILEKIINEALEHLSSFGDKGEFLRELAIYIKERNK